MRSGRRGIRQLDKDRIWAIRAEGHNEHAIARRLGLTYEQVRRCVNARGGVAPEPARRSPRLLSIAEREEISRGIAEGLSFRAIARRLGRSHTTISREIGLRGGRGRYRALAAEEEAWLNARRPKPSKLARNPQLRGIVQERLELEHSPEQIAGWLKVCFPDNEAMQVSHEAIYRSLYVQAKGTLKRELTRYLRTQRKKRRPRAKAGHELGKLGEIVRISERPPEVEDRSVPGHWEGDLLMGGRLTAIATLVERRSRYCQLVALPDGYGAEEVAEALTESIKSLPEKLRSSLTWDRGSEMARHREVTIDTGIEIYFCDPQSPWQRGSNENTNGLLRQYFPKGKSLAGVSQEELDEVAWRLNGRPRKTLGFRTPAEKLAENLEIEEPGR